ncbi:hypothetical protein D9758_011669 [Tetrapyrgos nigripes]|uniref:Uncharacterized protein n=1 Tax=Tetrapyrgos nigripes TaxID=182062 RepID=A0A8H5LML2_9AGAR|nr:hypothetical protein D9758_011669 [Tetrapyrgos nigripes]
MKEMWATTACGNNESQKDCDYITSQTLFLPPTTIISVFNVASTAIPQIYARGSSNFEQVKGSRGFSRCWISVPCLFKFGRVRSGQWSGLVSGQGLSMIQIFLFLVSVSDYPTKTKNINFCD